jgi:PAS domain-containing protein
VKRILERLLLQHNPDALLAISETGEILHWNDAAEAIFVYSCDEALGRPLNDLIVPPDRRDEERRMREDALRHGLAVLDNVQANLDLSAGLVEYSGFTGLRLARRNACSGPSSRSSC